MIRGYCIGGGLGLAVCCDLRICSDNSKFGIPAAKLGLGYSYPGVKRLSDLVGPSFAKEIFFTARQFDAEEARVMGLVNRVVPQAELETYVKSYADTIAGNAPLTVKAAKFIANETVRDESKRNLARCTELVEAVLQEQRLHRGPAGLHGEAQAGIHRDVRRPEGRYDHRLCRLAGRPDRMAASCHGVRRPVSVFNSEAHGAVGRRREETAWRRWNLRGLAKRYGPLAVVDDVSLTIEHGRLVCLLGPSGCGKTTTLAADRRLRRALGRRDPGGRAGHVLAGAHRAARAAQHVDDLPELRAVAAHDGRAERRLWAGAAQDRPRDHQEQAQRRSWPPPISSSSPTAIRASCPAASSSGSRSRAR